jgi:hypothetical protein
VPFDDEADPSVSRRAFLGTGLAVAGGLVVANSVPAFAAGKTRVVAIPFSSDLYASPDPQRFTLVLQQGGAGGIKYVSGPPVQVRFKGPDGTWTSPIPMVLDRAGLPKGRGVYHSLATFGQAGIWDGEASFSGTTSKFSMSLPATAVAPVAGQQAPRAASPTKSAPLGVKPICTRVPQCPLHTVSLSDVVGAGKPVAVLFATPALCASQYCGPVLDELLAVQKPYEANVAFVHVDIYKNLRARGESPTVTAWSLPSEPWLFTVDGAGTIVSRLDTAFGTKEMSLALDKLVSASATS